MFLAMLICRYCLKFSMVFALNNQGHQRTHISCAGPRYAQSVMATLLVNPFHCVVVTFSTFTFTNRYYGDGNYLVIYFVNQTVASLP